MSRAGLNRLTPHATAVLLLAANIPDVDAISGAWGALTYLKYHRHLTHSLAMAPVMALLPLLIVRLATRKPIDWKMAYVVSLAGVASHLALDLTNVYGIRLLLPFSARWLRLDITHVVDPWIWAALLLAVIAPALARLIGSEIGEKRRPGRLAASLALIFVLLYDGARGVIHQRALAMLDSRVYDGVPPRRVAAFPSIFNPFAWRGVVEAASYILLPLDVRAPFDPTHGRVIHSAEDSPAAGSARRTAVFQDFLAFSQFPVWTVTPISDPPSALRVEVSDLRFSDHPGRGFTATAIVDAQMRVVRAWFQFL